VDSLHIALAAAGISALGILSPGPDFIVVSHSALAGRARSAAWVAGGVVVGNVLWAAAGLLGLSAVFALAPALFIAVKVAGALYLGWLGVKLIRGAHIPFAETVETTSVSTTESLRRGLVTTITNPKAAVFYASVLTTITPPSPGTALVAEILLGVLLVAATWYAVVVALLSAPPAGAAYRRAKKPIERTFGILLVAYGGSRLLDILRTYTQA
jgi:threonine efflux protein